MESRVEFVHSAVYVISNQCVRTLLLRAPRRAQDTSMSRSNSKDANTILRLYDLAYAVDSRQITRHSRTMHVARAWAERASCNHLSGCLLSRAAVALSSVPPPRGSRKRAPTSGNSTDTDGGDGADEACRRGLKMSTTIRPKMMSRRRNIHALLPVFFWYLGNG